MEINEIKKFININKMGKFYCNKSFKELTSLRIGGKIPLLYKPNCILNFLIFALYIKEKGLDFFVIGNGTNILAGDKEYDKIVISFDKLPFKYIIINCDLLVFPSLSLRRLCKDLINKDIFGYEFLSGIPASIGGAICMNAGSFGQNISQNINKVFCYHDSLCKWYEKDKLFFSYRNSLIKEKKFVVLSAFFKINRNNESNKNGKEITANYLEKRRNSQPLNTLNAGCCFKNPSFISAGKMIEELDLKGKKIGGAMVSFKHGNFLINYQKASANDMIELIDYVRNKVEKEYNIYLEIEWIIINFN